MKIISEKSTRTVKILVSWNYIEFYIFSLGTYIIIFLFLQIITPTDTVIFSTYIILYICIYMQFYIEHWAVSFPQTSISPRITIYNNIADQERSLNQFSWLKMALYCRSIPEDSTILFIEVRFKSKCIVQS